jgi:hypothetical protein
MTVSSSRTYVGIGTVSSSIKKIYKKSTKTTWGPSPGPRLRTTKSKLMKNEAIEGGWKS